ncbi:MAG: cache domain-containing protein [Nitratireductor sp.]
MNFRTKLLLITIFPMVLIAAAALILVDTQSRKLAKEQGLAVEQMIRASKQIELQNYMKLVRTAVDPFYSWNDVSILQAQKQVADVVTQMTFGTDGYFFIARKDGTPLKNPLLEDKIGITRLRLQSAEHTLISNQASSSNKDELYQYSWNKPSTGQLAPKLSDTVSLDDWNWVIGSGLYLDDIAAQIGAIQTQLEDNVQQTRKVLLILSLGAVLLTSLFFALVRFSEQRLADEKLKKLASEIVEAQESERKRVSSELHDGISQLLVSARYGLDIANVNAKGDAQITTHVEKADQTIALAISEIRRISMALRPSILDDMGLASALKSLGNNFQDQTQIKTNIKAANVGALLDDSQKTCLFRVAQEALANVAKHSMASQVDLTLSCERRKVTLVVKDNGRGFNLKQNFNHTDGSGLTNMRERVQSHGGLFSIQQNDKNGIFLKAELHAKKETKASLNPTIQAA